jgi:hypothetical protein
MAISEGVGTHTPWINGAEAVGKIKLRTKNKQWAEQVTVFPFIYRYIYGYIQIHFTGSRYIYIWRLRTTRIPSWAAGTPLVRCTCVHAWWKDYLRIYEWKVQMERTNNKIKENHFLEYRVLVRCFSQRSHGALVSWAWSTAEIVSEYRR